MEFLDFQQPWPKPLMNKSIVPDWPCPNDVEDTHKLVCEPRSLNVNAFFSQRFSPLIKEGGAFGSSRIVSTTERHQKILLEPYADSYFLSTIFMVS